MNSDRKADIKTLSFRILLYCLNPFSHLKKKYNQPLFEWTLMLQDKFLGLNSIRALSILKGFSHFNKDALIQPS